MNDFIRTQCLRVDVGGVRFAVHFDQAEALPAQSLLHTRLM